MPSGQLALIAASTTSPIVSYLKGLGVAPTRINSLANIVMLSSASNKQISNTPPSVYLKQVEGAAAGELNEWLATNLLSAEAYEAATRDDFDAFLAKRAESIHAELLPKAGWAEE